MLNDHSFLALQAKFLIIFTLIGFLILAPKTQLFDTVEIKGQPASNRVASSGT